ncbi:hypothetical protein TSUD_157530 [Trifolium subterraneum]|uniref:ACT domain-containing protein n=1 Tax=Trifolium subterraneum TaxID=3900 RepID=A0A2Z6MML4_TRISU|nr:hypothetical protein TSUD_157530 [Trifolium subterraneum]
MEEINNTPMNTSEINKWLSDLEMDEYNLFPEECNLNFLDADEEEFLSHDIVTTVFQEQQTQQQQQPLTSESTALNNSFTDETNFESFNIDFEIERPIKQLKTTNDSDKFTETLSPKLSPSSSNSSFQSRILSFDNSPNSPPTINTPQIYELKQRLEVLEEKNKKTNAESVVVMNKQDICINDDNSSCDESIEGAAIDAKESVLQVEARVSGKEMLIRIHCQKHKGLIVKIMAEIQRFQLFVVNSSVLPFGNSILDITIIAQD